MSRPIEWYRPAITKRMLRVVIPCSLLTLSAALLIGGGVLARDGALSVTLVVVGVMFAIAGPTTAAYGVLKFLKHDVYLALCTDGVRFHGEDGADAFVQWESLERATSPDAETLEIHLEQGPSWVLRERFIGIENKDLATRICELQRKALLGVRLR